jgi:hypothetical protein
MKQFPYAQQIIWENDAEQIEWVELGVFLWSSGTYIAKLKKDGTTVAGKWHFHKQTDELFFVHDGCAREAHEIWCWAKL